MATVIASSVAVYQADAATQTMNDGDVLFATRSVNQWINDLRELNDAVHGTLAVPAWTVTGQLLCGGAEAADALAGADELIVGDRDQLTSDFGITILAGSTSGTSRLNFGDTTSLGVGGIVYPHVADYFQFRAANVTCLRLTSTVLSPNATGATDLGRTALRWGGLYMSGAIDHTGTTVGLYGTTPAAQSSAYTVNATAVPDRTLLASASATTTNNNNVLAALIADLQSRGFIG